MINRYGIEETELDTEEEQSIADFFQRQSQLGTETEGQIPTPSEEAGDISAYFAEQSGLGTDTTPSQRLNILDAVSSGLASGMLHAPLRSAGMMTPLPKEAFPPELQGIYGGAKVISDAVPITVATLAATTSAVPAATSLLATRTAGQISQTFRPIVMSFANSPRAVAALEAYSVLGSAQGRAIAESLFPGNEFVGLMGEMTGAMFNPVGTAIRLARTPLQGIYASIQRLTPRGAKKQAAEYIAQVADSLGDDRRAIAAAIEENMDSPLLPAQVIDSKTTAAISNQLTPDSELLRNSSREALDAYNTQIMKELAAFTSSGDPELVRLAAQIRRDHFGNVFNALVDSAKDRANVAVSRITRGADPAEAAEIARQKSDAIQKELESVYKWGRNVQDELYPKALEELQLRRPDLDDMDIDELYPNTMQITLSVRTIPGENINAAFTRIYGSDIGKSLSRLTEIETPQPLEMYTLAQAAARKAESLRNAKSYTEAQVFEDLNRTILDDLHAIDTPLLDTARDFTAQYRQTFDRTFASVAIPRTAAETRAATSGRLMERAIAPGGSRTLANIQQLENAADFNVPNAAPRAPTGWVIHNEAEGFLLAHASKFIKDGQVNATALNNFRARNPELMRQFPTVDELFQDATKTQQALNRLERSQNLINTNIVNVNVFQRVLNANETNLEETISGLFRANPASSARQLSAMIRRFASGSEDQLKAAQEGLVGALIDQAMVQARTGANSIDWIKVRQRISPELIEELHKNTLITKQQADNMNAIFDRASEVTRAVNNPTEAPIRLQNVDLLSSAFFRGIGAESFRTAFQRIGMGGGSGPQLVIAQSGAQYFQQKAALDPLGKVKDILIQASLDKELYLELLKMAPTIESAKQQLKNINAALFAAGITTEENEEFYNSLFQQQPQEGPTNP